jgi:hypothetical protein
VSVAGLYVQVRPEELNMIAFRAKLIFITLSALKFHANVEEKIHVSRKFLKTIEEEKKRFLMASDTD